MIPVKEARRRKAKSCVLVYIDVCRGWFYLTGYERHRMSAQMNQTRGQFSVSAADAHDRRYDKHTEEDEKDAQTAVECDSEAR